MSTIRKTETANGPPNDNGKFVTMIKAGPRCLGVNSFADSEADVDEAGYSPPAPGKISMLHADMQTRQKWRRIVIPKPTIPRATVIIQNMSQLVTPCAVVAKMPPTTIIRVVKTMAVFRPR